MKNVLLIVTGIICLNVYSQVKQKYSNPIAPIGDMSLTVPNVVKPILDTWIRDPYVMLGPDNCYYLVATTATPGRKFTTQIHCWDYNDGLYMWRSKDLKKWKSMGLIWSYEKDATWQKKGKPVKAGATSVNGDPLELMYRAVWAPELHYVKSQKNWFITTCQNGGAGSFILKSTSGKAEGPYSNIEGNEKGPIFKNIDLSLFEDDNGEVYAVGHNHFIAKMKADMSDLAEPWQKLKETPYNPEPYIEGVYIEKKDNKYHLLQTVWSVKQADGSYTYLSSDDVKNNSLHSYDVVIATADTIYGPYSERYPAIIEGGHNTIFKDKNGEWWSTTFFNPKGEMGKKYDTTCRFSLVAVKWENGKLKPDVERNKVFYKKMISQ
jgi:beta-xylosidase